MSTLDRLGQWTSDDLAGLPDDGRAGKSCVPVQVLPPTRLYDLVVTPTAAPGRVAAVRVTAAYGVETASEMMQACSKGRSSGIATRVVSVARTSSAVVVDAGREHAPVLGQLTGNAGGVERHELVARTPAGGRRPISVSGSSSVVHP